MPKLFIVLLLGLFLSVAAQDIICIDPGHGGSDPGAVGWGQEEEDITLDVAGRLYTLLKNAGWRPYLTRSSDSTVSLSSRVNYANSLGAKRFISIHCNAYNGSAHGTETFCYSSGSSTSFRMRDKINPQLVSSLGTYNRGCKTAGFYVIKYTSMPAILCELAFIDNQSDCAKLKDSYYQQKAAEAIKRGLENSYSREPEQTVEEKIFVAPKWSPDGKQLLVSNPGYNGLYLVAANSGKKKCLSRKGRIGYNARWVSSQQIQYRANNVNFAISSEGQELRETSSQEARVISENGIIWFLQHGYKQQISKGKDTFFNPHLSPDGRKIAYEGLATGIHVYNMRTCQDIILGKGNNPSWTPDSKQLVYEFCKDNGHDITSADLYLVSIAGGKPTSLTKGLNIIAQRPSISPDGTKIAFDSNGKIMIGELKGRYLTKLSCLTVK